ncbi:MAG: AsmA family protein [Candidatus Omnitrophica bacterium]|nr:AsmA family protein [Candidatus Omnitrophota bacterium]
MIKRLNLVKISVILVMLVIFHFTTGLFISPAITNFVITQLNKNTTAKISLDKAEIWPLTLSIKLINLKIFDPDDTSKRIISVPQASFRLSIFGLLSKRMVVSHAVLNKPEISLEGREDGSFNIQNIVKRTQPQAAAVKPTDIEPLKNKDVFGKVFNVIKEKFSKKQVEAAAQKRKEQKEVAKIVENLPRGKLIHFKSAKYLLEIVDLDFNNATISFKSAEGNTIEITEAKIQLRDLGIDPNLGMRLDSFTVNADLSKDKLKLGGVYAKGISRYVHDEPNLNLDIQLKDVNLKPLEFIYRDSLPVVVEKGVINLSSRTSISPERLDSKNDLHLKEYFLSPKENIDISQGFMPIGIVCDALNKLGAIDLNFDITGTPEKPEFKGFQESLDKLIKPVLSEIGEKIQEQGFKALENFLKKKTKSDSPEGTSQGEDNTINPVDILKSILGGKEESK